jgi:formylglycine-generating enzyme required for sulfatase activity
MRTVAVARALAFTVALPGSVLGAPRMPATPAGMVLVGPGTYRPLYPASPSEQVVAVGRFFLDAKLVTNGEFLGFVQRHAEWRRDRVKRLLVDTGYLSHWADAGSLGPETKPASPVTNVSWFAAKAYCAARSARLPSEREWELAAAASEKVPDGSKEEAFVARILAFYSKPAVAPSLRDVGLDRPNFFGLYDMHGLVWEWVYDYGASLVAADSREKEGADSNRFCGTAGANAQRPSDYAAFMRIAFRSSLEAAYTTTRLGFRCAADLQEPR